jgi:hypothetical protein
MEFDLKTLDENLRRLRLLSQKKGLEELKAKQVGRIIQRLQVDEEPSQEHVATGTVSCLLQT